MIKLNSSSPLRKKWRWGMDTILDIKDFILAIVKHWYLLVSGGFVVFIIDLYQRFKGKSIPWRSYLIMLLMCLIVASFLVWRDERNEKNKLISEKATVESQQPVAKLPFDLQIRVVKDRIKHLKEYLKTDTMSLVEVTRTYGNHFLGNTDLYDWSKVMIELERQEYIKIIERKGKNIIFKVLN
jgi:hypothetical protein